MSKGSSYWGTATGKIGNTVVRVRKGVRVESAYQPNVSNPRSGGQVIQRGKFSDAVGFYKRALANFFKMAFEDKRSNETDFNAFMRHNVSRAYVYSRQMVTGGQGALPYIGKWLLTYGSLFTPQLTVKEDGSIGLESLMAASADTTLGDLFGIWIAAGFAQKGDIFTFVRVMTSADGAGADEYTDEKLGLLPGFTYTGTLPESMPPMWSVDQYEVDPASDLKISEQQWANNTASLVSFKGMGNDEIASARAAACILTRKVANGLLCSTSQLVWNKMGENMMTTMATDDWLQGQRKAWSSQDVILAGALV